MQVHILLVRGPPRDIKTISQISMSSTLAIPANLRHGYQVLADMEIKTGHGRSTRRILVPDLLMLSTISNKSRLCLHSLIDDGVVLV